MSLYFVQATASINQPSQPDAGDFESSYPTLTEIWVAPVNGDDANDGDSRAQALHTIRAAWSTADRRQTQTPVIDCDNR